MKKNTRVLIIIVLIMITGGWLLFRTLNSPASASATDDGFRAWFWEKRGLDLVVQVILVFAGALGIAAILPVEDQDD
jgi:hypothetical protein